VVEADWAGLAGSIRAEVDDGRPDDGRLATGRVDDDEPTMAVLAALGSAVVGSAVPGSAAAGSAAAGSAVAGSAVAGSAVAGSAVAAPATVGRDAEVAVLSRVLADTAAGTGGCLVLTGAAGIGKTHLMDLAARQASELGLAVAAGRATELDRVAPLTTLGSALGRCQPRVPGLGRIGQETGDRFRLVDLIGELLEDFATDRPVLIAIDDAQWADEFSVLALRVLVPALSSSALRWVLARRPGPAHLAAQDAIDRLVADGAEEIVLHPLNDDAIGQLCAQVVGVRVDATVLSLAGRGSGNPFLVEQLLTALRSANQLLISDGTATVVGDELPSSFLAAVAQRLRGLSDEARRLLGAGSIFGRAFTVHEVAQLIGTGVPGLIPVVEEAVAAQVLIERQDRLVYAHDLLREAIYHMSPSSVRAALHREAARLVGAGGAHAVEVATHLIKAGADDHEAVKVLHDAAIEVADRAPGTAADLIVGALGMLAEHDPARPALSADAVGLLASASRLTEARECGEAALRGGLDPSTEAMLLLGLAEAFKHAGQNRTVVEYAGRGLAGPNVPDRIRARLFAIQAHALLYVDNLADADRAGAEADRLGIAVNEYAASTFGRSACSVVAWAQGRLGDALAHAAYAVDLADQVGGDAVHRHPRIWLGAALAALDRFDEAEAAYTAGRREAERLGTAWSQPLWHYYYAGLLTESGRLDDAVAEAEAGVRTAQQLTAVQLAVPMLGMLARLAVLRGEIPLAREHMRRMQGYLDTGITAAPEDVIWSIGVVHEATAGPVVAYRTMASFYAELADRPQLLSQDLRAAATLVRIALAAGAPQAAAAVAGAARDLADRNPSVVSLGGAAAHAEGLLRQDPVLLRSAVDLFGRGPRRVAWASAMEDAALAINAEGDRSSAVELLEQALETAVSCGARRSMARIDDRLRRLGRRKREEAEPERAPSLLSGLTPAERRVAGLVATGLTNRKVAERLYLSRHTVDSHLRHIFGKLGINSRVRLTAIVVAEEQRRAGRPGESDNSPERRPEP
jgi:DNA-binding CsgD family transcriptional regulator